MNVFEFAFVSIDGNSLPLSTYQGQPLLIVNTASECGFTPQYNQLQRLWLDYRQTGLIILGIPCDDFGHQEPGDEESIAAFCEANYQVGFLLTGKYSVIGKTAHPLFRALRDEFGDDVIPGWNFYKYLFDRSGQLIGFWPSKVLPDDNEITDMIESRLTSWVM